MNKYIPYCRECGARLTKPMQGYCKKHRSFIRRRYRQNVKERRGLLTKVVEERNDMLLDIYLTKESDIRTLAERAGLQYETLSLILTERLKLWKQKHQT